MPEALNGEWAQGVLRLAGSFPYRRRLKNEFTLSIQKSEKVKRGALFDLRRMQKGHVVYANEHGGRQKGLLPLPTGIGEVEHALYALGSSIKAVRKGLGGLVWPVCQRVRRQGP